EFAQINVMAPELEGVSAEVGELRSYPLQSAFYHTIGYVAKANEKDIMRIVEAEVKRAGESPESPEGKARIAAIRRLYKHPAMRVGKQGIEAFAEHELKGEAGKQRVLINAAGRVIDRLNSDDIAGKSGNPIMIAVATGEVVCMMSTPAPDPTLFVSGIATGPYNALREDEKNPLYHKAYDGVYPPGSTFKIVVAAAALESGKVSPEDSVYCSGRVWYVSRFYHCWRPLGHGRGD